MRVRHHASRPRGNEYIAVAWWGVRWMYWLSVYGERLEMKRDQRPVAVGASAI
jgi:hypothetical protein